jgi:hypothetical protein
VDLPKASKSTFVGAAAASALVPPFQGIWGMKLQLPTDRRRIGYFDTEMSDFDFYRQIDKILALADKRNYPIHLTHLVFARICLDEYALMIEQYLIDHKRLRLYYCGRTFGSMSKLQ